jgi:hypothetical protein
MVNSPAGIQRIPAGAWSAGGAGGDAERAAVQRIRFQKECKKSSDE